MRAVIHLTAAFWKDDNLIFNQTNLCQIIIRLLFFGAFKLVKSFCPTIDPKHIQGIDTDEYLILERNLGKVALYILHGKIFESVPTPRMR